MISKFKDFIKISFVRDVGVLEVGKFFFILLSVASSVILARLLGPQLYGIYGLVFAFVGLIGVFMNWGGAHAGLTLLAGAYAKGDKKEIENIITYFIEITIIAILVIGVLSVILAPLLTDLLYNNSQIGSWARIVLIATFLTIVYNLLIIVLQVFRRIKQLAILESLEKLIRSGLPVIFVFLGWGLVGVVWGYFTAIFIFFVLSVLFYLYLVSKYEFLPNFKEIFLNLRKIKLKKYFNFGFLIAIDKNLSRLISLLPIIALGIFTLPEEVGYFKIAFSYITISSLILEPISRLLIVQLPKSRAGNQKLFKEHFWKTTFYSGSISVLLITPFIVLAPFLVKLFYGTEYIPSIELIYYLSILIVFYGFSVGISAFYRTVNRMKISIAINISHVILMILLIYFLVNIYSPLIAVILSIILCAFIFFMLHIYFIKSILKKYER